jgi:hypothetical protein
VTGYDRRGSHLLLFAAAAAIGGPPSVLPETHSVRLASGHADHFTLSAKLPAPPPIREPLDVVFLFDATASMEGLIRDVQRRAEAIMDAVAALSPDVRFGVTSLGDYESIPWRLHQDLTHSLPEAKRALMSISLVNGGDAPEAYCRALYEVRLLSWRRNARRYVILFGDAPAHDRTFYRDDYGPDPGRDGVAGTGDDLALRAVVADLARARIKVIAVHDHPDLSKGKPLLDQAIKGFTYMAAQTGGVAIPIRSSEQVQDAIEIGLRSGSLSPPRVTVPPNYTAWSQVGPGQMQDRKGQNWAFDLRLRPPRSTAAGIYEFPVTVFSREKATGEIGRCLVSIRVPYWYERWRWIPVLLVFLVFASLVLLRAARRGSRPRYERNRQFLGLLWRLGLVVLFIALLVFLARWTPPEPPRRTAMRDARSTDHDDTPFVTRKNRAGKPPSGSALANVLRFRYFSPSTCARPSDGQTLAPLM